MTGQTVTFTASNFNTPSDITWVMGDGTTLSHRGSSVTHAYAAAGNYTVKAFDWNGDTTTPPVTLVLTVSQPSGASSFPPPLPRVDQPVEHPGHQLQVELHRLELRRRHAAADLFHDGQPPLPESRDFHHHRQGARLEPRPGQPGHHHPSREPLPGPVRYRKPGPTSR